MSYYLFLDDVRQPNEVPWVFIPKDVSWVRARSYQDFVHAIDTLGIPEYVSYDCDLCNEHYASFFKDAHLYPTACRKFKTKCGIHCLEYMLSKCSEKRVKHPKYSVHTLNIHALPFMKNTIQQFNNSDLLEIGELVKPDMNEIPEYALHDDKTISGFFGKYRFLSNFWPAPVALNGFVFQSVEVAYQAAKCSNPEQFRGFVNLNSPNAKQRGKIVNIRPDWDAVKIKIMTYLVTQKFNANPDLRDKLLATGDRTLIEANTWKDNFWGVSYRYSIDKGIWENNGGKNLLGIILMDVRSILA